MSYVALARSVLLKIISLPVCVWSRAPITKNQFVGQMAWPFQTTVSCTERPVWRERKFPSSTMGHAKDCQPNLHQLQRLISQNLVREL